MGNPNEASFAEPTDEDAPPPYQQIYNGPRDVNPYSQPASSYGAGLGADPVCGLRPKFPPSLNAYFQAKFTKTFYLGEKREEPLFAVRMHSGFTSNPELVFYEGPDDKGAILATANYKSKWNSSTSILTVPAHEGVDHDTESQRVEMHVKYNSTHQTFRYTANVGVGKETHCEEFEWRASHGDEVKELHGYRWGRKLVRLSNPPVSDGGDRHIRASGSASDGHEVIGVWTYNDSMSMTKVLKFQFMGSALKGMLGERGTTLAIISALRIWWLEYNQTVTVS
ncbi:hypothetical protein GGS21DRAFT_420747 [Xylaria nigripes]|nr:hypothetical protein GGS21DRAFT_420747 [Xylaria nigripes]